MTTLPAQNLAGSYNPKGLCRIVGFACLAGFLVDMFALTFPPALGSLEWRIGFLQQISDRSVILLLGLALVMYSLLDLRQQRRQLATFCLVLGILFNLSCILVIRDSLEFQQQTLTTINNQTTQLQTQIQKAQQDAKVTPNLTSEQLQQASQQLNSQAASLKQNTKNSVFKTGVVSVGNLIVVGLALIGLAQYGARPPRL